MMNWLAYVACMSEVLNLYKSSVRKAEGKRQPEKPEHGWEGIKEMG
jgi:hypothetical protein